MAPPSQTFLLHSEFEYLTRGTGIIFIRLEYLTRVATERDIKFIRYLSRAATGRDIIFIRLEYLVRGATATGIMFISLEYLTGGATE